MENGTTIRCLPCVRSYDELKPDPASARIATNLMVGGREVKIIFSEFELPESSILVEGRNPAHLEAAVGGKWQKCGDCSFLLSPTAFAERTSYSLRDNMEMMPP
jgi:hypothetical protein